MDKLKRYIDCYISTETCNLRCHYCYITQKKNFNTNLVKFKHSPKEIRKALSIERLGGVCLLNICAGGETLLGGEVINVIKELLKEGHYLMIVTNGTLSERFDEITRFPPDLLKRLIIKFSFHYLELLRVGKLDVFFDNVNTMKNAGCSFTVEITPNDELIPYIEDVKKICMDKLSTLCHVTIARDDRTGGIEVLSDFAFDEYKKIWNTFQSNLFDFKTTIFYKKRKEFCYAGDWSLYLNLSSGRMTQCYCGRELGNIYKYINKPLKFEAIGHHCTIPHCYNGHAFLTLGVIPDMCTPTYTEMRDRIDNNGGCFLQPEMKAFLSQKLSSNNKQYSIAKKSINGIKAKLYNICMLPSRMISKIKHQINKS